MSKYWAERVAASQSKIADKTIKEIDGQLKKYYASAMKRIVADFEATYNKLLSTMEDGKEPTPADLYKLDKYWQMQGQLKNEMQKLGDKEITLMSKKFEDEWHDIYKSFSLPSDKAFNTFSKSSARGMINSVWTADGKNFSQRIWKNTEKLVETLNDNLVHCVVTGKKPTELKKMLQERFNVSYNQADALVRTEAAHIQTIAAQQRYKDYGITEVEVLADEDERRCDVCGKLHETRHPIDGPMPVPAHPRCRCAIVPVIDDNESEKIDMFDRENKELVGYVLKCDKCGGEFERKYLSNFAACPHCGQTIYPKKEEKMIYADKDGNRRYYTDQSLREEEAEIRIEARNRAARKTTQGTTESDPYTTAPLAKQIKEAKEKEGTFTYYTHSCPHCGRYFSSTVRDKKKCPLCGGNINTFYTAEKKTIEIKKCVICDKLYNVDEHGLNGEAKQQSVCPDCRQLVIGHKDAEKLKKHGYSEAGIISELTGEEMPKFQSFKYKPKFKHRSSWDMYWEYIQNHPEDEEKIESMKWESGKLDIHFEDKHFFVCIDCGEVVFTENVKNNAQKRCPDCQAEYRKRYKAQKEKERRAKKKK